MKILVSNIGSTSFKFKLFDQADGERVIASGGADRIGQPGGVIKLALGDKKSEASRDFEDHGACIRFVMDRLVGSGVLADVNALDAVAFKAVMGGDCDAVERVTDELLARMERFVPVAPAHNPPYIAAMRMFGQVLGDTPLVACFEPGFHKTNPRRRRLYATPPYWASEHGVQRYGFHGASHRYIATKMAELVPEARRIISCHLGGSSSLCAIRDGQSIATSMGLSPQSGLPQSSRCGDFDAYGLKMMASETGRGLDDLLAELGSKAGLAAMSGTSGDMRDIREGTEAGDENCALTYEIFATAIRDYLGAYLVELGGADAIVFTGGIGQHDVELRKRVLDGLAFAGIQLHDAANAKTSEGPIHAASSGTQLWVLETNEELIVARQAAELLASDG
jgi:acetate kinase